MSLGIDARLADIIASVAEGIVSIDDQLRIVLFNPAAEQMFGRSREEMNGQPLSALLPERFRGQHDERIRNFAASGQSSRGMGRYGLIYGLRANGEEFPLEATISQAGTLGNKSFTVVLRDVSWRLEAEKALRKNYELLDRVFATTHFCLVYLDRDFNFVRVNKAYADACGHPPEFFLGKNHFELYPGEKIEAVFRRVVATGEPFTMYANPFEFPDHPERGVTYWDWSLHPLRGEGGDVEGLLFALLDVTERERTQEAFRLNERSLRVALKSVDMALFHQDLDLHYTWMYSPQLGYSPEDVMGKSDSELLPPEDVPRIIDIKRGVLETGVSARAEVSVTHLNKKHYFDLVVEPLRDAKGELIGVTGASLDITERKRAEVERAQLAAIVENSNDAIVSLDLDRTILSWNGAAERLFGYSAAEVIGRKGSLMIPADQEAQAAQRRELLKDGIFLSAFDTVRLGKGGRRIDVAITASPIKDASGKMMGISLVFRDISERKHAEAERAQLAAIVESSNDAIFSRGADGTILTWNAAAERLFGWSAREAIGRPISMLLPPERIRPPGTLVDRTPRAEPASPVQTTHVRKDGVRIQTQVTFSPVMDRQGNVIAVSNTVRDMTELMRKENALRVYATRLRKLSQRLREVEETERHAISRELHDRIGQGLTTLSLMVGTLDAGLSRESRRAVQPQLKDIQALLRSVVAHVRDVMAELRPPVLDDYGLLAALRHLVTEFSNRTGIAVNLSGVDPYPRLPLIVETAMFRISQEALNNIVMHAHAKRAEISLKPASDRVVLDIADDGVGFDTSDTRQDGQHWGIITMRERAEAVGITFRLESAPGAGTRVVLEAERAAS